MKTRPRAGITSRLAMWLGAWALCLASTGCVTTARPSAQVPAPEAPEPSLLTPGQEVTWTIENAPAQPGIVPAGRSLIGPDGTIVVGPYGSCAVAGMTQEQAARNVEKILQGQVRQAKVRVEAPGQESVARVVWRKSVRASGDRTEMARGDFPIRRVGGKQPELKVPDVKAPAAQTPDKAPAAKEKAPQGKEPKEFTVPTPKELDEPLPPGVEPPDFMPPDVDGHGPSTVFPSRFGRVGHHNAIPVNPGAPAELNPVLLPSYVIGPPDVLVIDSLKGLVNQPIRGPHLVRPDGTVGIGSYGSAPVAGLTLDQAKEAIARVIHSRLNPEVVALKEVVEGLTVDVLAYNSKVYYVITDGGGYGEQVVRLPVTGSETVLDAISQINGLSPVSSKHHVWIARRTPGHGTPESILKVDWIGITQRGAAATNYQIMPGDRVYVRADRWRAADAWLGKVLAPIERLFGATLLGSQTVNSIKTGTVGGR